MSTDQREAMKAKLTELRSIAESASAAGPNKERLGLITTMLLAYPTAAAGEESGRARAQAYLGAVDDIPPWAIAETIKRWHRGECGPDGNYRFAPAPAELRGAAMNLLQPAKQVIAHLEMVLQAGTIEQAMDPNYEPPVTPRLRVIS